jgi:hypothetical protein
MVKYKKEHSQPYILGDIMAIILWPYNISTKNLIIEDSINNCRDVVFYNNTGSFELIQGGNQVIIPSINNLKEIMKKEDLHLLCPSLEACKRLEMMFKKHKIKTVKKSETYIL